MLRGWKSLVVLHVFGWYHIYQLTWSFAGCEYVEPVHYIWRHVFTFDKHIR